jgi:hypothetical protein
MRLLELVWNNELEQRIFIHNKANHIRFWSKEPFINALDLWPVLAT